MKEKARATVPARSFTPAPSLRLARKCACGSTPGPDGRCPECEAKKKQEEMRVQRSAAGPAPSAAPASVASVIGSSGTELPAATRGFFESRLGHDFSGVRIHNDAAAAASAHDVNALAYTVGDHVVFGAGEYRPETARGAQLLAHELAHTVQQRGLQTYSAGVPMAAGPEDARLEREADDFARAVASGVPARVPVSAPAGAVQVSRAARTWTPIPAGSALLAYATAQEVYVPEQGETLTAPAPIAFRMKDPLTIPAAKGPHLKDYEAQAKAGALEANIAMSGGVALKQGRAPTYELRSDWLQKVGWSTAEAAKKWHDAGGDAPSPGSFPTKNPTVKGGAVSCDMDHIVELQVLGTNYRGNVAPLDSSDNRSSGSTIWNTVSGLANNIAANVSPQPGTIILHFDEVVQPGGPAEPAACPAPGAAANCYEVDFCALKGLPPGATKDGAQAGGLENYNVLVGGGEIVFRIDPADKETDLLSSAPENQNSAEAVPGMILRTLKRGKPWDTMTGTIENSANAKVRSKTKVPMLIQGHAGDVPFLLLPDKADKTKRRLTLKQPTPKNITFTYPYLSDGKLTQLSFDKDKGLLAKGKLKPSVPFLPEIGVEAGEGQLKGIVSIDPKKFRSPIKAFKVTKSDVAVSLAPELSATGTLDFAIGDAATGTLEAKVDKDGFGVDGKVKVKIPGVDNAEGNLSYRGGQWTGGFTIEKSSFTLPAVQTASVHVGFNNTEGLTIGGNVGFLLPSGDTVDLSVKRGKGGWVYSGTTTINLPRLNPTTLHVTYDGKNLTGWAKTGLTVKGFTGSVTVNYGNGKYWGESTLGFKLGKAAGSATVKLHPSGKFSGKGSITYPITKDLVGTIGLDVPEAGPVRATGTLAFAKPITLFNQFSKNVTLFKLPTIEIPIFAVPLGVKNIGLVATIDAGLTASFSVGPGQFKDIVAQTAFNPLEENPDLVVDLGARLVIPASAGLSLRLRGGLGVSVVVASATGGINLIGSIFLKGGFDSQFTIHYEKSVFVATATAAISAGLILGLDLTADVTLKGLGLEKTWEWPLAGYRWDTGLGFKIEAPVRYASNEKFVPPSLDDIKFTPPQLDFKSFLPKLLKSAEK